MHRRIVAFLFTMLMAATLVVPVSAVEPSAPAPSTPEPTPTVTPSPSPVAPDASPAPSATPAATTDPADQGDPSPAPPDATPTTNPPPSKPALPDAGPVIPDTHGRYIVMLKSGADTSAAVARAKTRDGVHADRTFTKAVRGFTAKLDTGQRRDLLADPNVVAVVPDGVISITAQTWPTGIRRVGAGHVSASGIASPVDADVAIVDTGLSYHPDLNVAGGYNCSTSDHSAWRDRNDHGTHVAGTIGALDNGFGVVGVAPGARVYGVKILNDDGYGLISWYICGLDWILAQRDPNDASRPLFEAVNMSVTKDGSDDGNCGLSNHDPLHQAICRVVAGGITVVAAAANDSHNAARNIPASYNEVITVSALADTDGLPGGLGGNKCFSWGSYDKDDTFANFSNYGADVDIMAPGKCILSTIPGPSYALMSGTSMAAPTVTGAVALYKSSRPNATPAEVREALRYLGNYRWALSTDPDGTHEPLLDVSRLGPLGTFDLSAGSGVPRVEAGTTAVVPFVVQRSPTFFERVRLSVTSLPDGWTGGASTTSLFGWNTTTGGVSVTIPAGTPLGRYQLDVRGTNQGRTATTTISVDVVTDNPTAKAPSIGGPIYGTTLGTTTLPVKVIWPAATDPTSGIARYEVQVRRGSGNWGGTQAGTFAKREATFTLDYQTPYTFRVRARDAAGNWSTWMAASAPTEIFPVDDRSGSIRYRGTWKHPAYTYAFAHTLTNSKTGGSSARLSFTGHGISVIAPRGKGLGIADVYVDGKYIKHLYMSASTGKSRQVVFTRSFPAGGSHTIEFRVHASGQAWVGLDAFVVAK